MPTASERQTALGEVLATRTAEGAPELYDKLENKAVRCYACGHRCKILEGLKGICKVRYNEDGVLRVPRYPDIPGLAVARFVAQKHLFSEHLNGPFATV